MTPPRRGCGAPGLPHVARAYGLLALALVLGLPGGSGVNSINPISGVVQLDSWENHGQCLQDFINAQHHSTCMKECLSSFKITTTGADYPLAATIEAGVISNPGTCARNDESEGSWGEIIRHSEGLHFNDYRIPFVRSMPHPGHFINPRSTAMCVAWLPLPLSCVGLRVRIGFPTCVCVCACVCVQQRQYNGMKNDTTASNTGDETKCRDRCCSDGNCSVWQWSGLTEQCIRGQPNDPDDYTTQSTNVWTEGQIGKEECECFTGRGFVTQLPAGSCGDDADPTDLCYELAATLDFSGEGVPFGLLRNGSSGAPQLTMRGPFGEQKAVHVELGGARASGGVSAACPYCRAAWLGGR
jgi:hypothetical protein